MFGAITCLFFLNCRWETPPTHTHRFFRLFISHNKETHFLFSLLLFRVTDEIFNFLLVWYYCTLTIRESILMSNGSRCALVLLISLWQKSHSEVVLPVFLGYTLFTSSCAHPTLSRIKGWWVSHHYVSTFLSGVMLTWWVSLFVWTQTLCFSYIWTCVHVNGCFTQCLFKLFTGQRGPCIRCSEASSLLSPYIKVRVSFFPQTCQVHVAALSAAGRLVFGTR